MSWPSKVLNEVCERISVGHVGKTSEFYTNCEGVPFLRTQNVSKEGINTNELRYITPEFERKLGKSSLRSNDVVLSRVISKSINCGIVPHSLDGANCANIILVRPDQQCLDSNYLLQYLRSQDVQNALLKTQVGSAQSVVNTTIIKNWEIPLPPLEEQRRIAAILDKADAIRRKRQQAIALADEFLRSVFLDMFGDPVSNPKGWETRRLADIGEVVTGNTPSRKNTEYYGDHIEWIKSDNINTPNHYLTIAEEYLSRDGLNVARTAPTGSLLVTCIAGSKDCIGNIAITDRTVAFNQQINALVLEPEAEKFFVYAQLLYNKSLVQAA